MPKKPPFLNIDLGKEEPVLRFAGPTEALDWVIAEQNQWQEMRASPGDDMAVLPEFDRIRQPFQTWRASIERAISNPAEADGIGHQLSQDITTALNWNCISFRTAVGQHVLKIKERHGGTAACAAAALVANQKIHLRNVAPTAIFEGLYAMAAFRNPSPGRAEAEAKKLADARGEALRLLSVLNDHIEMAKEQSEDLHEKVGQMINKRTEDADKRIKALDRATRSLFKNIQDEMVNTKTTATGDLENLKKTYSTELALQKPITFWKEKQARHKEAFITWSVLFLFTALAGGAALIFLWFKLLKVGGEAATIASAPLWEFGALALSTTVYLVALRILSRLIISETHLAKNADERAVMAETFISLAQGGHVAAEDNLKLILAALFKQTSTGLVKEDAVPPSLHEMVLAGAMGRH